MLLIGICLLVRVAKIYEAFHVRWSVGGNIHGGTPLATEVRGEFPLDLVFDNITSVTCLPNQLCYLVLIFVNFPTFLLQGLPLYYRLVSIETSTRTTLEGLSEVGSAEPD